MSAITAATKEPTPASVWQAVSAGTIDDELLEWPPDVFALTDVILERSEAYRHALSPPPGLTWPPADLDDWDHAVVDAGRRWGGWIENGGEIPDLLTSEWRIVRDAADLPLADLTHGRDWRVCQSLLTLHAIADEACAGLGVALDAPGGIGCRYRARGREFLTRTGSLARLPEELIRVLPKLRTPSNGTSLRSLSRYATVHRPGVRTRWHKVPARRPGTEPYDKGVNYLLLPWPLRVRESDFRPLPGSVRSDLKEPFGFFEFVPSERLDLGLVDRMLLAAKDEVSRVNVVVLPESAVDHSEIDGLEALLTHHDVIGLIAGVRQPAPGPGRLPANWVHMAVSTGEQWVRIRQNKHHRWTLDDQQIYQYHLGGALHPHIRWWEAMAVPRRSIQILEVGEAATVVSLVCEDLAQIDDVADVLRSVGPTIVVTPLLDGPQLSSRWAARYASVLADDPGSTVLTLTSFGMARRSRPRGGRPSTVVALWKDAARGTREIALEGDAQGILLSASADRAMRRSTDGRRPIENGSELFDVSIHQVRAAATGSGPPKRFGAPVPPALPADELTTLTAWAEALAEAVTLAPQQLDAVLADARDGTRWRAALGLPEPSAELVHALDVIERILRAAPAAAGAPPPDAVLAAAQNPAPDEPGLERLARRVLRAAVEQIVTRQTRAGHDAHSNRNPTSGRTT